MLITLLATLPLLYLPGWAVSRALNASPTDLLERHYERVAISALWSGWLALLLAELSVFSFWLHLAITLVVCVVGLFMGRTRGETRPPAKNSRAEIIGFAIIGVIALFLAGSPFEVLLGVRDAGVYADTGLAIARTGSLVQSDPLLAEIGRDAESSDPAVAGPAKQALSNFLISQPKSRYIATRLRMAGFFVYEGQANQGRVVPQGLHLLPAWIALLTVVGGPHLGLFAPGLLAVLGAWSVGMLGRRLAGPWVGLLAFLFLALNGAQVWFARYSTAETVSQFLIWAGLYFFAKMESESDQPRPNLLVPLMAGVSIGQVALARLDFFLLGPVLGYLLYCWLSRRWSRPQTLMALGLGAMLLHAGLHLAVIAQAYLFDTGYDRIREYALLGLISLPFLTPELRNVYLTAQGSGLASRWRIWLELLALAATLGGLLWLRAQAGLLYRFEMTLISRRTQLLRIGAVAILLITSYAYLVRPNIIDADLLFNTRSGWNDPLTRDPSLVAGDVRSGRLTPDEAHTMAGVVMQPGPYWFAQPDLTATQAQRERLAAERGPWQGPFSNQTGNWLRLQGYIGAPIHLPVILWYNEFKPMNWWQRLMIDPATLTSAPAPLQNKETIPFANLVRVGWYLSPLGIILGVVGYALWWRHGLNRASWLFLAVAFVGTFFFVRQTYGTSDQTYIYILRRFVPIAYPAFSLGMGYALVALVGRGNGMAPATLASAPHPLPLSLTGRGEIPYQDAITPPLPLRERGLGGEGRPAVNRIGNNPARTGGRRALAVGLTGLQLAFFVITNQPIYRHVEYAGALDQLGALAARFTPGRDVLLLRGGDAIYADARDVPDLVVTPLRFVYGLDAFTVKSSRPGSYAADLAAEVAHWQARGRQVYVMLSASGAGFALPGYRLEPTGSFTLNIPEFEQLTNQKPRNVAQLNLPFQIYRAVPSTPGVLGTAPLPLAPNDFVAQVTGFYRPEARADGSSYAWTNGDAQLRLAWPAGATAQTVRLTLAGGTRPDQIGPAAVCISAQPEVGVWPGVSATAVELGCMPVSATPTEYAVRLDPAALPPAPGGTLLLRMTSDAWVPAAEDSRQTDQRAVGVQFGGLTVAP